MGNSEPFGNIQWYVPVRPSHKCWRVTYNSTTLRQSRQHSISFDYFFDSLTHLDETGQLKLQKMCVVSYDVHLKPWEHHYRFNEKKPGVSVNKTLWIATVCCIFVFFIVGIPGVTTFTFKFLLLLRRSHFETSFQGQCPAHARVNFLIQALIAQMTSCKHLPAPRLSQSLGEEEHQNSYSNFLSIFFPSLPLSPLYLCFQSSSSKLLH